MKRFNFRLQRVMRVREIERDQAQAEWVKAQRAEAAAKHQVTILREQAAAEHAGIAVGRTMTQVEVRTAALRASLRARAAEIAMVDLAQAEKEAAEKGKVLYLASQKVDAMGRLEVRHRDAWALEARREEALVLDDIATTRSARQQVVDRRSLRVEASEV